MSVIFSFYNIVRKRDISTAFLSQQLSKIQLSETVGFLLARSVFKAGNPEPIAKSLIALDRVIERIVLH
jgi:hypothetical protein